MISSEDLEQLEKTLAVPEDSAVAELVEAHRAFLDGDVVRGVEAVRPSGPGEWRPLRAGRNGTGGTCDSEVLPEVVALAFLDFITGTPLDNPRRIGAPLRGELEGVWTARRGTYRVLCPHR